MCGIAGVYRFDLDSVPPEDVVALAEMSRVQRHRGPDDDGDGVLGACALASGRLSILDLSPLGHMPMLSEDGRLALIHNGEIYNYVELRAELRSLGHDFRSDGDTEVILHAYAQWGAGCVERFVGMWAFALYDAANQTLVLSRDRLGIKPLYVHRTAERLVFASEIKAIVSFLRKQNLPFGANTRSIATFVATGLVDGLEETFFEGITRFPAATTMRIRRDEVSTERYWDLPARASSLRAGLNGVVAAPWQTLAETLDESVRVHLRSDVPLGVCLSGGLDSSAIVGLASRYVEPIKTFTIYFSDGPDFDEREYARTIVRQFNAESYERCVEPDHFVDDLRRIVWALDEPSLASGVYPQWHVMALAREAGVKVVLDGQGGDEVFAGYTNYATQHLYGLLGSKPLRFPLEALALGRNQGWPQARTAARSAVAMRLRPPAGPSVADKADAQLLSSELQRQADLSHDEWLLWPRVFDDWLNNVLYWELTRTRLPALLRYEDRLSMAFSIESRVPFLDHRLVELAFALPDAVKRHAGWSKYGLRRALDGRLPASVVWRRDKKGFPTPIGNWLRDGRGAAALDLLRDPQRRTRRMFPQSAVDGFLRDHVEGRADRSWQLWRALGTELWLDVFQLAAAA
jgi:asparagine synthase (glutamine-hydrolysing)